MIHNIFQIIEPAVGAHATRTAIVTPTGEPIAYRRLGEIVAGFAARASAAGIVKGDRVSLHGVSMTQYLCTILALSKLGAVYVRAPDDGGTGVKADHVLVDSTSGLSGPNVLSMDFSWPAPDLAIVGLASDGFDRAEDLCLVLGTSGTTGQSKQLGFSLALIADKVDEKSFVFGPLAQRILLQIPPTTPLGLQLALLTLRSGGTIVLPRQAPPLTLSLLREDGVDQIFAPPAVYSAWIELLKRNGAKLSGIKRAIITGSFASPALIQEVQACICKNLTSNYGSSELGVTAHANVDELAGIDGAVGKLVDWIETRVSDDHGNVLPAGQEGRLEFRPKAGQRRAPYLDGHAQIDDTGDSWFAPGDVGTVTRDGVLCIRGRATDLMNVGGNKIAPSLVEAAVSQHLGTSETVCALGLPGPNGFDEVVVVVGANHAKRIPELPKVVERSNLGLGRVHFLAIKSFPLSEFGKVDRTRLREMVAAEIARQSKLKLH